MYGLHWYRGPYLGPFVGSMSLWHFRNIDRRSCKPSVTVKAYTPNPLDKEDISNHMSQGRNSELCRRSMEPFFKELLGFIEGVLTMAHTGLFLLWLQTTPYLRAFGSAGHISTQPKDCQDTVTFRQVFPGGHMLQTLSSYSDGVGPGT